MGGKKQSRKASTRKLIPRADHEHDPKTAVLVVGFAELVGGEKETAVGGAAASAMAAPEAAAQDMAFTVFRSLRILPWTLLVVSGVEPVGAPFQDIPVEIVQAERIRRIGADFGRAAEIRSLSRAAVRKIPGEVGLSGREGVAGIEGVAEGERWRWLLE